MLELGLCLKLFKAVVLLFQLSQPSGMLGLYYPELLSPAVVSRLRGEFDHAADVNVHLALGDQLLGPLSLRMICSAE